MKFYKLIFSFAFMFSLALEAFTQTLSPEQRLVEETIRSLFEGMRKGDSTMVREAFTEEVTLATIFRKKNGEPTLFRESSLKEFLKAVGTPHKEEWVEEYWNLKIEIDQEFASASCDYAFYLGNTFIHCGIDAFHLYKTKNGWRIFHLSDTRRKDNCQVPDEIRKKHL
jgi:hypothetical protein